MPDALAISVGFTTVTGVEPRAQAVSGDRKLAKAPIKAEARSRPRMFEICDIACSPLDEECSPSRCALRIGPRFQLIALTRRLKAISGNPMSNRAMVDGSGAAAT